MVKNIGTKDARIRITIAMMLVLIALLIVDNPYLRIVMALIGAAIAASAYLRVCLLYNLLGKNTAKDSPRSTTDAVTPVETSGEKSA